MRVLVGVWTVGIETTHRVMFETACRAFPVLEKRPGCAKCSCRRGDGRAVRHRGRQEGPAIVPGVAQSAALFGPVSLPNVVLYGQSTESRRDNHRTKKSEERNKRNMERT
eukprot:4696431-Prymnesium_polylepis.1